MKEVRRQWWDWSLIFSLYVLFIFAWTGRETYWTHYRVTYIQYLEEMAESAQRYPDPADKIGIGTKCRHPDHVAAFIYIKQPSRISIKNIKKHASNRIKKGRIVYIFVRNTHVHYAVIV